MIPVAAVVVFVACLLVFFDAVDRTKSSCIENGRKFTIYGCEAK